LNANRKAVALISPALTDMVGRTIGLLFKRMSDILTMLINLLL